MCVCPSNHFYAKVDSLYSAFLWKNKTASASGARVAWKDICKPNEEGGVGIRLLEAKTDLELLHQLWLLMDCLVEREHF